MKRLRACVNEDGRPVQPPSKVLCASCLGDIGRKMRDIVHYLERDVDSPSTVAEADKAREKEPTP